MDIQTAKQIKIADFLHSLGYSPVKQQGINLWYKSPLREETEASFKVNTERNQWYDFALGKGGNIIALASRLYATDSVPYLLKRIEEQAPHVRPVSFSFRKQSFTEPSFQQLEIVPLSSPALLAYLQERGINPALAKRECREARFTHNGKRYFAVAFPNILGGYEIRNRFFKGCLPPKDVTLLAYGSASCNLYEGFMDYLSARVLGIGNGEDHLVLNSVSNLTKAYRHLDGYGKLQCHFDNDEAGRRTLEALRARYGGKVTDCSGLYGGCKDLNDYLQKTLAERQAWRENEKKGKNNGIKL